MRRLKIDETGKTIESMDLTQQFTVKAHQKQFTIRAILDWEGISVDDFFNIGLRGWIVAIQAKLRQLPEGEIYALTKSGSKLSLADLFTERSRESVKEKLNHVNERLAQTYTRLALAMFPELGNPERLEELKDVLVAMNESGPEYLDDYELKG